MAIKQTWLLLTICVIVFLGLLNIKAIKKNGPFWRKQKIRPNGLDA